MGDGVRGAAAQLIATAATARRSNELLCRTTLVNAHRPRTAGALIKN